MNGSVSNVGVTQKVFDIFLGKFGGEKVLAHETNVMVFGETLT